MNHRERFHALMNFQSVDRLPETEWAPWWDKTLARWHGEGLPANLTDTFAITQYFGLDPYKQAWITFRKPGCPAGNIHTMADYEAALPTLYPDPVWDRSLLESWAEPQRRGELVVWITLEGFFWGPRTLFGIEEHLLAFYDQPELMHRMNRDILAFNRRALAQVQEVLTPDFMTFAEDMSYNHGPMIGRGQFEEFMAPYYRQIVPELKQAGTRIFVDSDGDITQIIDWLLGVGIEGILPLERMAGVDVAEIRRRWPQFLLLGAFDKTVMHRGEAAIRQEFERLMPVMRQGGFLPGVDHQTPPGVSLEQYQLFRKLLAEYCRAACR